MAATPAVSAYKLEIDMPGQPKLPAVAYSRRGKYVAVSTVSGVMVLDVASVSAPSQSQPQSQPLQTALSSGTDSGRVISIWENGDLASTRSDMTVVRVPKVGNTYRQPVTILSSEVGDCTAIQANELQTEQNQPLLCAVTIQGRILTLDEEKQLQELQINLPNVIPPDEHNPMRLALSPDATLLAVVVKTPGPAPTPGARFAFAIPNEHVRVLSLSNEGSKATLLTEASPAEHVHFQFSADSTHIAGIWKLGDDSKPGSHWIFSTKCLEDDSTPVRNHYPCQLYEGQSHTCVAVASPETWCAAFACGKAVKLVRRGNQHRELELGAEIAAMAYWADGRYLATVDAEGMVQHWDARDERKLLELKFELPKGGTSWIPPSARVQLTPSPAGAAMHSILVSTMARATLFYESAGNTDGRTGTGM